MITDHHRHPDHMTELQAKRVSGPHGYAWIVTEEPDCGACSIDQAHSAAQHALDHKFSLNKVAH